jgi:hypothetical protein
MNSTNEAEKGVHVYSIAEITGNGQGNPSAKGKKYIKN